MKITHIFVVVLGLHFAVVGTLFVFPGCQGVGERIRPQGDHAAPGSPFGDPPAHSQQTQVATRTGQVVPASPEAAPQLLPPTQPSWNIASDDSPEVIEGEAVYEETGFNAINPELDGLETVIVAETVVTSLPTEEVYTVKKGDNLTRIANAKGLTLSELMAANNLNKNSILQIGQTLVIPADGLAGPTAPVAPTMTSTDMSVEGSAYEVQRGDTLGAIARRYGTSVTALRGANNLSGNTIYAGQTLIIPEGSEFTAPPPLPQAAEEVELASGESTYVVKSGDTLGAIAKSYGVTVRELAARNNISDPRRLRAGQTLIVPGEGTASPAPASAPAPAPRGVQPTPAPVPAPSQPVVVEETDIEELDFDNLDDIPVVPVQTSE